MYTLYIDKKTGKVEWHDGHAWGGRIMRFNSVFETHHPVLADLMVRGLVDVRWW